MDRVVLISSECGDRALADAIQRSGVRVVIDLASSPDQAAIRDEIIGTRLTFVIGEEPGMREILPTRPRFDNPRPYLKRKKGRS